MDQAVVEMKQATKKISNGPDEMKTILHKVDFTIQPGDFITVLGGNGAGKSTLFNGIAGNLLLSSGSIKILGEDVTEKKEEYRAKYISRVFQDPKMGTAPRMTVAENLLLSMDRGKKRTIRKRKLEENRSLFYDACGQIGNGLEKHLDTPAGNLSGGQRQALSLLMATISKPDLLLLDEHTAALDPKTSRALMALTNQRIQENSLTCLMITHRMEDALNYGNRLIVLEKGEIKVDVSQDEKKKLTLTDLLGYFEEN